MRNNHRLVVIFFFVLGACVSQAKSGDGSQKSFDQFPAVSLGDSKTTVIAKLGPPKVKSSENFNALKYETWSYSKPDGSPLGSVSVDPDSGLVSRRLVWISDKQPEEDFVYLKTHIFPSAVFEEFNTCDQHWDTKFRIDRKQGILVGIRRQKVFMVAWSDPRLTKLQVEQLALKCPEGKDN
jgi:hypothetical protein